jgi:hypothetical protein
MSKITYEKLDTVRGPFGEITPVSWHSGMLAGLDRIEIKFPIFFKLFANVILS